MPSGFMDGATITSALTYLNLGKNATHPAWHTASALEATYLLLHDDIHIIPRPKGVGGEHGDYAVVASTLPELIVDSDRRKDVLLATFEESAKNLPLVQRAWNTAQEDNDFKSWAEVQRQDRWINQVLTYGGLFDKGSIEMISKVSGFDVLDVERTLAESSAPANVKKWLRSMTSEEAQIASAGWIIGGFMRGLFYDKLAAAEGLHLLSHPFRAAGQEPLESTKEHEVTNSEQLLVKIILANALQEPTRDRRIRTWAATVRKAREFITTSEPDLRNHTQPEAEERAIYVAKKIDLKGGPHYIRTAIDIGIQSSITGLAGFTLSPWLAPTVLVGTRFATAIYKEVMEKSPGEQLGDLVLQSSYRFRWLSKSVPGRIERTLPDNPRDDRTEI